MATAVAASSCLALKLSSPKFPFLSPLSSSHARSLSLCPRRIPRPLSYTGKPFAARLSQSPSQDHEHYANELPATTSSPFQEVGINFSACHSRRRFIFMVTTIPLFLPWLPTTGGFTAYAELVDSDVALLLRTEVRKVLSKAKAAGVLRLAFHDAGTFNINENTGGMNGSVVYELDRPENAGLNKSLKVLEKSKCEVDKVYQVSWADLIAISGSEAVSLCGGPQIPVRTGRIDARVADPLGKLPEESLDASRLKKCFLEKGFSTQELVALSGAHTLGNKGFGNPYVFDNSYYKILLEKPWTSSSGMIGLPSDRALVEDEECLRWITLYAGNQAKFFDDFSSAYIKLVDSGAVWG